MATPSSSTTTTTPSSSATVSLPRHLREPLTAVLPVLPTPLAAELAPFLINESTTIASHVLQHITRWARTPDGVHALEAAKLDPLDYSTVALFAGTRTTPGAAFSRDDLSQTARTGRRGGLRSDRKGVTALANAIFSIIGAGAAAWWAASSAGWGVEKSLFLGVLTGFVVAVAEAVLFTIWQKRSDRQKNVKKTLVRRVVRVEFPTEPEALAIEAATPEDGSASGMRHRKTGDSNTTEKVDVVS
ncbi:hypothetical protein BKA62DRAFT_826284 [Auriculariales sp. MPI-PUGE-AT-0066]|nr:hypothetical protein BKA62DRAFT_826284 [Auriculariales sp. MPI-PUGE-AT-0066]